MLGRGVAAALRTSSPSSLFAPDVVSAVSGADLVVLNLECCISNRGERWPGPGKPYFFRAPPVAVEALALLGVDCVTLANNHALDFGGRALLDTVELLAAAGIAAVGAGADLERARAPTVIETNGFCLAVFGVTDHPREFAAARDRPGVALAPLGGGAPGWLVGAVREAASTADAVLVSPHWGPNMATAPSPSVRRTARDLLVAGATVVAGHSAHVFHGVEGPVLYDLGDFVDDYATDPVVRNDLGLLFLLTLTSNGPEQLEVLPLKLEYCHTRIADADDADWIRRRFTEACAAFGTEVGEENGRLLVDLRAEPGPARQLNPA
jgi:poly-gamma-glutamate synthesis protein (capsule biosynthesis protein)